MKVIISGNSVSLKIRPPRKGASEKTFVELLSKHYDVLNKSRAGVMINEQFSMIDDDIISQYPDIVILNFGIVELFERSTVRYTNNKCIKNHYNNYVLGRPYVYSTKFTTFFYKVFNRLTRVVSKVFKWTWVWCRYDRLLAALKDYVAIVLKECDSIVIIIEVPLLSTNSKRYNIKTNDNINRFNNDVFKLSCELNERVKVLKIPNVVNKNPEIYIPDGIHFSGEGHEIIFNELKSMIKNVKKL